jgi:hypothetical protein
VDYITGQSYEHRREWVEKRIRQLASIFTIDVAAYSVLSNHYHIVVRVDRERVADLSTYEVIYRWAQLYQGPLIIGENIGHTLHENILDTHFTIDTVLDIR